jgi:polysaccharide deacetylase family protein (PEP-CTERM system associated)
MLNALSVDVEDYFQVSAAEHVIPYEDWDKYESRVVKNTLKVLSILKEFNVKATFFVLGWLAERFPQLVKEIHSQGHEIACHGYAHRLIYNQMPEVFREDIRKAKVTLEKIVGSKIIGYRAPSCSVVSRSLWALEILVEEGFQYDSSIYPLQHTCYGTLNGKRFIHRIDLGGKSIIEFPLSTLRICGTNFAIPGGGYLRLYPLWLVRWAIKHINKEGYPAMVYVHPWEMDPEQPRIKLRGLSKFKHYVNLSKHEEKIRRLVSEIEFSTIWNILDLYKDYLL